MEENELIALVLQGDNNKFSPLISRYSGMVYSICFRILGNHADAEDAAHDTFVEAYIKLGQLQDFCKFGSWLRAIATNLCCGKLRNYKLTTEIPVDHPAPQIIENYPDSLSYSLPLLSPSHRLVLALHYMAGLDYDEIAAFLAVPVGTVMSRLHRARQMVQKNAATIEIKGDEEMIAEEQFANEVMAEIAVLIPLIDDNKTVKERLSILLRRSPDILIRMLNEDDAYINNLAMLLPRLGADAIDVVATLSLAKNNPASHKATLLLVKMTERLNCGAEMGWQNNMPPRVIYMLLRSIIQAAAPNELKASLLLELLKAQKDDDINALISCMLMTYKDAAFPLLMLDYYRLAIPGGAFMPILATLCRYGDTFVGAAVKLLQSECTDEVNIGLIAAEALSKSYNMHIKIFGDAKLPGTAQWQEMRTRSKWSPVVFNADVLADAVVPYLKSENSGHRISAVRTLMQLKLQPEMIELRLNDSDNAVKRIAIAALAEMKYTGAVTQMIQMLNDNTSVDVLMTALSRLKATEAVPALLNIANNDEKLRLPAVAALAEIDMQAVKPLLLSMLKENDDKTKQAAVKLLYRTETTPREISKLEIARLQRLRGDKIPVSYKAIDAAIRFGITDDRKYSEQEITSLIAGVCHDYSGTRRQLIETCLMQRKAGIYTFTKIGEIVRQVEQFVVKNYLAD